MRIGSFFLIGVLFAACGASPTPSAAPAAGAGDAGVGSGTIAAINADGAAKLLAEAKGKVVVLNLWATWCPPCVAEMPYFSEFYRKTERADVVLLSLCVNDISDLPTTVRGYVKEEKLPFPVYLFNMQTTPEALKSALRTQVSGALPTTIVYDRSGAVREVWERDTTLDELLETVKRLI